MRCFIAIELPESIRTQLAGLQRQLTSLGADRSIRWTCPEHIHLTLKFLGEVPDRQVPEVCRVTADAVKRLSEVPVEVRGAGCFPPGGPVRVVWAGIAGPPSELVACQQALETAMEELGYPREHRPFRPHLTIGRSRDPRGARDVRPIVAQCSGFACQPWTAKEIQVIQSVLGREGPTYSSLARAPLCG